MRVAPVLRHIGTQVATRVFPTKVINQNSDGGRSGRLCLVVQGAHTPSSGGEMPQQLEDVQQRLDQMPEPSLSEDEILRRAGVSIPTMRDIAPFRAVRLRPRWLAFLIRVFAPRS